jgi:hypothetical protein
MSLPEELHGQEHPAQKIGGDLQRMPKPVQEAGRERLSVSLAFKEDVGRCTDFSRWVKN